MDFEYLQVCPFCGRAPQADPNTHLVHCGNKGCAIYGVTMNLDCWNDQQIVKNLTTKLLDLSEREIILKYVVLKSSLCCSCDFFEFNRVADAEKAESMVEFIKGHCTCHDNLERLASDLGCFSHTGTKEIENG